MTAASERFTGCRYCLPSRIFKDECSISFDVYHVTSILTYWSGGEKENQNEKMTKPKNKIEPDGQMSREDTVADLLVSTTTANTPPLNHANHFNHFNKKQVQISTKLPDSDQGTKIESTLPLSKIVEQMKTQQMLQDGNQSKKRNTLVWKDRNGELFTNLSTETNTEAQCSDVLDNFYFDRPDLIIRIIGQTKRDGTNASEHREYPDLEYCLSYTGKGGIHLLPEDMKSRVINLLNETGSWIVSSFEDHDVLESARQPYVMPVKVEPEAFPEVSIWPQSFTYSALYLANEQKVTKKTEESPYECILVADGNVKDLTKLLRGENTSESAVVILKGAGHLADVLADAVSRKEDTSLEQVVTKLNELQKTSFPVPSDLGQTFHKFCKSATVFKQDLLLPDLGIGSTILNAIIKVKPTRRLKLLKLFVYLDSFELAEKFIFQPFCKLEECYPVVQLAYVHKRLRFIDYFLRKGLFWDMQKNGYVMNSVITDSRALHFNETLHRNTSFSMYFEEHQFLWQDNQLDNSDFYGICDHLFRQCLMSEDFKMSMLFWLKTQNPLGALLLAYNYLKKAARREHNLLKKKAIKSASKDYQDLAVTFVNACYEKDAETTLKMLTRKMERYDNQSCIDIAMSSENLDFLEQPACVTIQRRVWNWGYLWDFYSDNASKLDQFEVESGSQKPKSIVREQFKKNWLKYFQSLFAPVTMFSLNGMGLLVFIFAFSLTLLGRLEQSTFHWLEWYLAANVVVSCFEEYMEMKDCFNRGRWLIYFSSGWNIVDMLSILLFIIGAALRIVAYFNSTSDIWFDLARLALCVDFIIFTLRLLHNCYSNQVLGPTCSMIFKTVLVLMKFLYILAVIWISYAVASEAILYPNSVLNSYTMFFLLRKAYWQMFGQFFLDEIDAGKPTDPNTLACTTDKNLYADYLELRCPTYLGRYVAPILMAVYVMFVNILLFNLITATFTKSIKKIQVQSGKLWRFQFFELTRDFSKVTFLPLPFTPVSMLARKLNESKKDEDGFSIYHQRSDHRARENALESSIRELEEVLDNQLKDINILKQAKENIKYQKVISRTRLDTIKKTFNEIEKFLIKMAIMDYLIKKPAENAQTLIAIQDNEKHCLLNKLIQYKENELSKNGKTANDKNMLGSNKNELDLWDKHVNGLLAEICKFGQENDIIQHIFKEIKNLKKHKYTSAAQLDTVKNLEQKVEELNQIRLPKIFDKTNVQDRRVNRIRAVRRRLEDLHCLLEQSPDQSIIDQNDNFFFQLQEKLKGLKTALTSLQCIYIRRETLNKINAFSDIVSQDIKGRDLLETEAKIKDLEVYVIQNHMEPKMQKKNFKAEDEQESSEEEPDDKVDTLSRNTKSKDDKTSLSKDDKENTEDDIPFIHWIPMYSDSQVTVNNDDSTTFIQEPEELKSISFNHKDTKHHVDRRSYMGRYELHDGKPLNPLWDKTSEGFSSLKRWGPNHFGIPVITRIKRKKNKIFRKANKVELEFLVRKSNLPGQYEFPQIPCFPNQDPFTEFMRDKSNYVKKVLKKHLSLSSIENLLNAVRQLRVLNRWRKPEPNPGTSPSTKLSHAENVEHKSPTISKTKSKLCETFRNWFRKSKKPEPLTSMLNSQIHVRSCQKVNTVYIGVAEEEMSKHKWKEIRIINYHNPNAENQAKLETDVSLEWVDSSKYKDIKEVKFISIKETTGKDIVKFVCALHDAYTERPASAAIVAVGKTMS